MKRGFTLIELVIVIAIIAALAAITVPSLLAAQRSASERNASSSLKILPTAEADFRANDRDNNHVQDFFTADVAGLYLIVPALEDGSAPAAPNVRDVIKLLDLSVAMADADRPAALPYSAAMPASAIMSTFQPKSGYWYRALRQHLEGGKTEDLRVDTDNAAAFGECHHPDRFAFCALPNSIESGRAAYIVDHTNTIFRIRVATGYRLVVTLSAGTASTVDSLTGTGNDDLNAGNYPDNPTSAAFTKLD